MAIAINTPKGQGYLAAIAGKPNTACPYHLSECDGAVKWTEWLDGWYQAYNAGLFARGFNND